MMGMKQDALAYELGGEWTQKKISQLEQRDTLEPEVLEGAKKKVVGSGQSVSSYINVLIREDLAGSAKSRATQIPRKKAA